MRAGTLPKDFETLNDTLPKDFETPNDNAEGLSDPISTHPAYS